MKVKLKRNHEPWPLHRDLDISLPAGERMEHFQMRVNVTPALDVSIVAGGGMYCDYTEESGQTFEVAIVTKDSKSNEWKVEEPMGWQTLDDIIVLLVNLKLDPFWRPIRPE